MAIVGARGTPKKGQNKKNGFAKESTCAHHLVPRPYHAQIWPRSLRPRKYLRAPSLVPHPKTRFHFCFCFSASASASLLLLLLFFISLFLAFPLPLFCFLTRACPTRRLVLPVPRLALRPERPHHEGPRTREHGGAQYPRVPLCIGTII